MVTDDDLIMDSCTIDIFFQVGRRRGLQAAQLPCTSGLP